MSQSPFSSGEVFHVQVKVTPDAKPALPVSQSPFSSGEVFHEKLGTAIYKGRFPTLTSQSPFSSGEVFHHVSTISGGIRGVTPVSLNPLLVAGKYSTLWQVTLPQTNQGEVSIPF